MRDDPLGSKFYDEGWNDRVDNLPMKSNSTLDYRDGWKDCDEYMQSLPEENIEYI